MVKATTDVDEIKQNLQEVGERIQKAFDKVQIPVQMFRKVSTLSEKSGIYYQWVDFDEFMELELRYHCNEDLDSCKTFKDLSGLWNSMKQVRDGLTNDLQMILNLVDQFTLAQASRLEASKAKDRMISNSIVVDGSSFGQMFEPSPNGFVESEPLGSFDLPDKKAGGKRQASKKLELDEDESDDDEKDEEDEDSD